MRSRGRNDLALMFRSWPDLMIVSDKTETRSRPDICLILCLFLSPLLPHDSTIALNNA
jgi:hypothetical protein